MKLELKQVTKIEELESLISSYNHCKEQILISLNTLRDNRKDPLACEVAIYSLKNFLITRKMIFLKLLPHMHI